jgi:hypothetical protein
MDFVRKQVFSLIIKLIDEKKLLYMFANPNTRDQIANMMACMYVGEHRIAPEMALEMFRGLDQEALHAKAENVRFTYKNVYNKLTKLISGEFNNMAYENGKQTKAAMAESMMRGNNAMSQFYAEIDALMNELGIHDDTVNDGINMTNEERRLTEAKFYSLLNKMNNSNF